MRLTILGRWSPYPPAGGASPGYLLEAEGQRLLLECGTGVLGNLQRVTGEIALQGVVVSHLHPDHVLDLFALKQALHFGGPRPAPPLPLLGPPGALDRLPAWLGPEEQARFRERFLFIPMADGRSARLGPFVLRFAQTSHPVPCFAVRVEAGGRVLAYSADTGPSERVPLLAREAHLFLCEATLREADEEHSLRLGHLSGRMAGHMAAAADAGILLLTHFFTPYGDYTEEAAAGAAKEFAGEVRIARELDVYEV
ncbi:MAG: MBL fold metallo-hydrolase [Armatimonadota bacterium]|nr:MBL fold metallo-hydrolase [Armatimonadota bacterium]MDR7449565.1 MBL fold metallo-hydrolase [Armatimonadota bacterium]MDR7460197.1 MBL fold metallo-hydrolase [Armatimonadota bacterium]MDR7480284.1 MBL fold metallo-hydrolase [Armatimonadota bacterium]MDR7492074.1 MBL fold metallo-hydrolase [Armatimonadota bacterium]